MGKKIMILGASILQLPAIKKAKEMGLEVVVVDMNPDAVGFQTEGIEKEIISTIDIPEIVKAAKRHSIVISSTINTSTAAAILFFLFLLLIYSAIYPNPYFFYNTNVPNKSFSDTLTIQHT